MSNANEPMVFQEMTWEEIDAAARADTPIVIPIGATEQHGRHLPVCTDWVIPDRILREAGRRHTMIVGPFLPFGYRSRPGSGGGQHFPGTVSLRATTFMSVIEDVLSELKRCGFRNIVLYNWHFENSGFVYEPAFLVSENNPELKIVVIEDVNPDYSPERVKAIWPEGFPGLALEHAAVNEASLWMYQVGGSSAAVRPAPRVMCRTARFRRTVRPGGSTVRNRAVPSVKNPRLRRNGTRRNFPYTASWEVANVPCSWARVKLCRPLPSCSNNASPIKSTNRANVSMSSKLRPRYSANTCAKNRGSNTYAHNDSVASAKGKRCRVSRAYASTGVASSPTAIILVLQISDLPRLILLPRVHSSEARPCLFGGGHIPLEISRHDHFGHFRGKERPVLTERLDRRDEIPTSIRFQHIPARASLKHFSYDLLRLMNGQE